MRLSTFLLCAIVLVALGATIGIVVWWLPREQVKRRCRNELHAGSVLKSLATAESIFRSEDRDGNDVNDFWTADVAGLHRYGLIDRSLAEADARPLVPLVPHAIPWHGYFFAALEVDDSVDPPEKYRQDTDNSSGKVHHPTRFGFVAIPAEYGVTGRATAIINEGYSMFYRSVRCGPIDRSLAEADANPRVPLAPKPIPKDGYYFGNRSGSQAVAEGRPA